jgi:hypothetical protein
VPSTFVVETGGAFCAIASPAPIIEIAKVTVTFSAFISASLNNPVLLDDRVGEKIIALNENILSAGRE